MTNSPYYPPLSSLLFLLFCLLYAQGFYSLVESSVWVGFFLTIILPALLWPLVKPVDNARELKRIFFLETSFNLLCFMLLTELISLESFDKGMMAFIIAHTIGFLYVQWKKQAHASFFLSAYLAISIYVWLAGSKQTYLDDSGSIILFGTSVPWQLIVLYCAWVLQMLLVEYKWVLPKLTLLITQTASIAIAIFADDFFHARIVTSSHLMFLSLCFHMKDRDWGGSNFMVAPNLTRHIITPNAQYGITATLVVISGVTSFSLFF
ncbi:conserved hypothetical protein [Vibrio nigripulchritudo MADA3029]|uniref:Uncharacterized protein n=1 Tax=Vibrio nigripulchritudo TaxID=28173 RepID=U4K3C3_9VIBR|nr:hypothetical protein [Vibrio nigripulchritudo]CCN34204.1 conserved hypothetical protein [Vibrio nigripulchritudo AM115]CCN44018.1 conserved hypothetical protein [Vibrio nigripulchritudo FTn2]CCN49432.1 conserved hypothetical protein [Vibrio nigripulchritudo MADA3020]CCN53770.1 conserved hypothetical protein [Vibrio nigripulchritudo MADA3021]CCN58902.1 conserved hypothetical protein [Vibrio nigripulchritudo MADA3029]